MIDAESIEYLSWGMTLGLVAFFSGLAFAAPFAVWARVSR